MGYDVARHVRGQEQKFIKDNKARELEEFEKNKKRVTDRLKVSQKDDALLRAENREEKREAHAYQRAVEAQQHATLRKRQPYATQKSDEDVARGTEFRNNAMNMTAQSTRSQNGGANANQHTVQSVSTAAVYGDAHKRGYGKREYTGKMEELA